MLKRCRDCVVLIAFSAAATRLHVGEASSSSSSPSETTATAVDTDSAVQTAGSSGEESYSECRTGLPRFLADGDCDPSTNTAECAFDGGDCCSCTCVNGPTYTCGHTGFDCLDPDASCIDDDDGSACVEWEKGDSYCDEHNNNEDCSWDGGDCCECTCVDTEDNDCDGNDFNCIDPYSECYDEEDSTDGDDSTADGGDISLPSASAESACVASKMGDGFCNYSNNVEECQYDGGDCCACTCVDSTHPCPSERFKCVDPDADCLDHDDDGWLLQAETDASNDTSNATSSSSGSDANTMDDTGGDDDILGDHPIGNYSISVDWGGDGAYGDDGGYGEHDLSFLFSHCFSDETGDAVCNSDNNNEDCDYDGGDCCFCTCNDAPPSTCGSPVAFNCLDPSVTASCSSITSPTTLASDDSGSSNNTEMFIGAIFGASLISVVIVSATICCYKSARRKRLLNIAGDDATSAPGAVPTIETSEGVPVVGDPHEDERIFGIPTGENSRHATLV